MQVALLLVVTFLAALLSWQGCNGFSAADSADLLQMQNQLSIDKEMGSMYNSISDLFAQKEYMKTIKGINKFLKTYQQHMIPSVHGSLLNLRAKARAALNDEDAAVYSWQEAIDVLLNATEVQHDSHLQPTGLWRKIALARHYPDSVVEDDSLGGPAEKEAAENALAGLEQQLVTPDEPEAKGFRHLTNTELLRACRSTMESLERQGLLQPALDLAKRVLPYVGPSADRAQLLKAAGVLHLRLGQLESAALHLESAIELNPAVPRGFSNLALALQQLERYEDAELAFREAARLEPDNANPWANLGVLYAQLHVYSKAREAFLEALKIDKQHAGALRGLDTLKDISSADAVPRSTAGKTIGEVPLGPMTW